MGARILVADDSVTIQKVVELTFSKEDFVLVQARSGEEAIRKAMEVRPDLILVDMVMPDKNGYEVCAALRAEPTLRSVPIILLTGTFESFDKERGLQAGANDFVTKPFESQVLISKVKQLLFARMVEKGSPAPSPGAMRPAVSRTEAPPGSPLIFDASRAPARAGAEKPAPPPTVGPGAGDLDLDLAPPTEEISQDRLWQLLESPPPAAAPALGTPGVMSLEDLAVVEPPPAEEIPLELPALDLAAMEAGEAMGKPDPSARSPKAKVTPLPETLSLEDLLSGPPAAGPLPEIRPLGDEVEPGEPIFDLTAEMGAPPLPLKEVATGEPAALSMEDLLGSTAAAVPDPGAAPAELSELDLGPLAEEAEPSTDSSGLGAALDLDVPGETPRLEVAPAETAEIGTPPVGEDWTIEAQGPAAPAGPESIPVTAVAEAAISFTIPEAAAGPPLEEQGEAGQAPVPPASWATEAEVASMRQAVTERVARDLTREISDKLADRIEKIVWQVVPDLAEVLITKEIERIRAMAENQKPS